MTRRDLLAGLGAGLIGSVAGAAPIAAATRSRSGGAAPDLERAGIDHWAARVGTRFDLAAGGSLRLAAVEPLCSGGPTPSRSQCFAAVFEAAGGEMPAGDATFVIAPAGGRPMPLFLSARHAARGRARLVAVFN